MKLGTRFRSTAMRFIASDAFLELRRMRSRVFDKNKIETPAVHYFHQVDDPYSFLSVQKFKVLQASYDINFIPHLVGAPENDAKGDATRYLDCAIADARNIASYYGVLPPLGGAVPDSRQVNLANQVLSSALDSAESSNFAASAVVVGENLWRNSASAENFPLTPSSVNLAEGEALRARLGHYFGAMFYYEGEWFWGLDRLHLLERRLRQFGFGKDDKAELCVPPPKGENASGLNASSVTLEYFPSLRSPYTAMGHSRVADLVKRSGVSLQLRPVMPMMMRGIPAPRAKQLYIMMDAAREARFYDVPFGRFVDPIGDPVLRAFKLFPAALAAGKGMEFVGAYLSASFAEGIDITEDRGLAHVAFNAGLDFDQLKAESDRMDWQTLLQENIDSMNEAGLWGVPGFRVSSAGETAFSCWGQDRIWRVEAEIAKRMKKTSFLQPSSFTNREKF
jgi:2-hydroxychromene-2-carboxylate isomerase